MSKVEKKPVLVRVKEDTYQKILRSAAKASVQRGASVSVPGLISELLDDLDVDSILEEKNGAK